MDCNQLNGRFQEQRVPGVYEVTIVSNQLDGIVGFGGQFGGVLQLRKVAEGRLQGGTGSYLFSDRTFALGPFALQPFSAKNEDLVSMNVTIQSEGNGQYLVELDIFGGGRHFVINGQCIEGAIVGSGPAIGASEPVETAIYTITVGRFIEDPH